MSNYRILCIETGEYLYSRYGLDEFASLFSKLELEHADFTVYNIYEVQSKERAEIFLARNIRNENTIRIPFNDSYTVIHMKDNLAIFEVVEVP